MTKTGTTAPQPPASDAGPDGAYAAVLEWLYALEVTRGWDLKLESVRAALARLGSPERELAVLHVAGTNGKGSTAAIAHAVLGAAGLATGLYTSPHLVDFRERIRVGDRSIEKQELVGLVGEIRARLRGSGIELTFFELATVLAFVWFARSRVDAAVVEVGLGGRLDATNVVVPRASIVTTIAFDHESHLGSTLDAIAREKAGILKPGVPAVTGALPPEALAAVDHVARERGSPLVRLGREFHVRRSASAFDYVGRHRTIANLVPGLAGAFQIDNAAVALAGLEEGGWLDAVDDETIRRGVRAVRWPGRLERIRERPIVVVDGAHNPAGVAALVGEIPSLAGGRRVRLVFGVLADKRWDVMARLLAPVVEDVVVVPVGERRSEDPRRVAEVFRAFRPSRTAPSGVAAVGELVDDPSSRDDLILVAGSLFLVGEVRARFLATA